VKGYPRRREYQLWEYSVSHGSLLIRSPKNEYHEYNCDIVFAGVQYIGAPRHLGEIELDEVTMVELANLRSILGTELKAENIFVFRADSDRHTVVAASMTREKNDMGIFLRRFG
jgi:hypothetical protein